MTITDNAGEAIEITTYITIPSNQYYWVVPHKQETGMEAAKMELTPPPRYSQRVEFVRLTRKIEKDGVPHRAGQDRNGAWYISKIEPEEKDHECQSRNAQGR